LCLLQALTKESDFDPKLLQTAVDLLNSQHAYAAADSLAAVLAAAVAGTDSARRSKQIKRQRTTPAAADSPANAGTSDGTTPAADDMEEDSELTPEAVEAEVSKLVAGWGAEVGAGPDSYEEAEKPYAAALVPLSVGVFDAAAAGAFNSQFSAMAAQPEGRRLGGGGCGYRLLTCAAHACSAAAVLKAHPCHHSTARRWAWGGGGCNYC
jgi:hypothetical protein